MKETTLLLLVVALGQIRITSALRCFQDNADDDTVEGGSLVCVIRMYVTTEDVCRAQRTTEGRITSYDSAPEHKCVFKDDYIYCYCNANECNKEVWQLRRQFEIYFESYYLSTGETHRILKRINGCREHVEAYKIGKSPGQFPSYTVKLCSVRIFLGKNNLCSSTQSCFQNTRLALPEPECSTEKGLLRCHCQANQDYADCTAEVNSMINKLRGKMASIEEANLKSCVNEFTEKKWPQTKEILKNEYSYECEGTHVGGWKGVKVCGILMTKHDDGTCLLEQQSRSLAISHDVVPACQNEGKGVICYCITNNCNQKEDNFQFGAYLEKNNHPAKSCMKMITSKVMSLHQVKKINVNSYDCIGDGSKFWESDNNRCGIMISLEGGECHSKQTSRSAGAGLDTLCWAEDRNVICLCSGDQCNQHQQSFLKQFEEFYMRHYRTTGKAPVPKACREMTAVYEKRHVKQEICAVALEEGSDKVCHLVQNDCFSSYQPVSLDCHPFDKDVRCFCEGEGCNQNPYDLVPQFDKFFADFPNHSKSGCYSKMRETTTTSSPTTTEEMPPPPDTTVESTSESTMDTSLDTDIMSIEASSTTSEETDEIDETTTIGTSTDSHPGSGSDGSELEGEQTLTTWKDVETEKLVNDDGKEEGKEGKGTNEGSNNPLIISSSAGVIFLVVVAVIVGCCFWKRNGGNKKGKPSKEGVIEVQPKPFFGPPPLPPTPATPAPSTPAVPLTPAPSTPAVPMSPATPIPVVPLTPATPTPAAPLTPTAPAKAAKKQKVRAPRKLSAGEIIAKKEAKRLRREELKKKAEIPVDVLSDRRFQKKGPLHFTNVQRELPDDPLTASGTMTGTGAVEFDDKGNELFYLGTDIEIIDDSIRTRPTQDEDDVEKTQSDDVEEKKKEKKKKDKKKKRKKSKGTGQKRKKKRRTSKNNVSSKK